MMNIKEFLRPNIRNFKPYSSARDEYSGRDGIFLDANENSFGSAADEEFNRYPDPYQNQLKQKIADIHSVSKEQIFLGNGSDEAIDLLIRAFCVPQQDKIMLLPPTYGMYGVCTDLNDVETIDVPLTPEFEIDLPAVIDCLNNSVKLLFICSPNNPSGNTFQIKAVETILEKFDGVVIIDEAYQDFSDGPGWLDRLADYDNLAVLSTFSKAWGMAGIRLGMAFASAEIIRVLNSIKYPYNINEITSRIALDALKNKEYKEQLVRKILAQRELLIKELNRLDIIEKVFPSQANFLLVRFKNSKEVFEYLMQNFVIVRDRSTQMHCENCLRITVGTDQENKQLLTLLRNFKG